jgi:hypothetical protein
MVIELHDGVILSVAVFQGGAKDLAWVECVSVPREIPPRAGEDARVRMTPCYRDSD